MPATPHKHIAPKPRPVTQQDLQRLETQVGQLIRIIANLNERINYLETDRTNPFILRK